MADGGFTAFLYSAIASAAISAVATAILSEDTHLQGQRLDNLNTIGSAYGAPRYLVLGKMRVPGNIIWALPLLEVATDDDAGGKGGPSTSVTNYAYFGTFAALVCEGVMARPLRIWGDKKLLWEAPAGSTALAGDFEGGGSFEFFPGTTTQGRSAVIEAALGEDTPAYRGSCYIVFSGLAVNDFGRRLPTIEVEVESDEGMDVGNLIMQLCRKASLREDQVDVSAVSPELHGVQMAPGVVAQALDNLLAGLGLQSVYDGARLTFKPIVGAVVAEIPGAELLASDVPLPIERMREGDLPRTVRITYIDPERDYQPNTQQRGRQATSSVQEVDITVPIAMTATQASQLCDVMLYRTWTARTKYGPFRLPPKYLYLTPGDIVAITEGGFRHLVRLRRTVIGANGALECEGEAYDASVYVGAGSGQVGEFPGQVLPDFGTSTLLLLDAPALLDTEASQPGYRVAAMGTGRSWRAAVLEESADEGITWRVVAGVPVWSVMGRTLQALPPPPAHIGAGNIDAITTVDVRILRGSLSSVTDDQLVRGANGAVIGGEVVQFGTAEHLGGLDYRLSRLVRGRRGTEHAMAVAHAEGASFAMLLHTTFVQIPVAQVGQQRLYRLSPVGGGTPVEEQFRPTGANVRPWSPTRLQATRDGAGTLAITWVRRSRIGTELPNAGGDIPLDEPTEGYIVDVLSGAGDVVRTLTASTPQATYTAAQQLADFGALQAAVPIRIAQVSNLLERGYPATATL